MEVGITARHCDLPDALRRRAEHRLRRLGRFNPRLSHTEAVFSMDHGRFVVEVILHVDGERALVGRAGAAHFRSALDRACDRAGRQLKRRRERRTDRDAIRVTDLPPVEQDDVSESVLTG